MQKIVRGIHQFQRNVFAKQSEWFEHLAMKQQKPRALFVTCADSRINPNLLTQTEPGELFILRNAGNIVPPYGAAAGGEGATIEYAVAVLGIKHLILCGHSHCGAMSALMKNTGLEDLPAVQAWFSHAEATRRIMKYKYQAAPEEERTMHSIEENVLVQLDNLRTHPSVAVGLARGDLKLYGWVYIIETGKVLEYDPHLGMFVPLADSAHAMPQPARLAAAV